MLLCHAQNLSPNPSPKRGGEPASPPSLLGKGVGGLGRPAATLTEVLVAIFVMGIGLLALLTLFPLGALSMAQAIKDDRTAHAAKSAFAIAEMFNLHNDPYVYPQAAYQYPPIASLSDGYVNPLPGVMPPLSDPTGPSYPVYVDPYAFSFLGFNALQPLGQTLGNTGGIGIARRSPALATTSGAMALPIGNQPTIRWFTLLDDLFFHDNALPYASNAVPGTTPVQRENRYSWAYMFRRPKAGDSTVVDASVVIYSGRSLSVLGETAYPGVIFGGYFDVNTQTILPTSKFVDLPYLPGSPPPIRRGSWILDATVVIPPIPAVNPALTPEPHGNFYRVVEVTDATLSPPPPNYPYPPGYNVLRLELQTDLKLQLTPIPGLNRFPATLIPTTNTPYGVLIVMENVVEVFDKGSGWKP